MPKAAPRLWIVSVLIVSVPIVSVPIVAAGTSLGRAASQDEGLRFFQTRVRPVLVQHCYECHGPDKQEGNLRLDSAAAMQRGGDSGSPVVSGQPQQSLLITAIGYESEDLQMPPDEKLGEQQIKDLIHWIQRGAPFPQSADDPAQGVAAQLQLGRDHWSFQPPQSSRLPAVRRPDWCQTALDRFILDRLQQEGLAPNHSADKQILLRRAKLDLTGLPPDPDELFAFLADGSPDAMSRLVDRQLASVHYGQRWGRHWLDVARYADSNGLDENVAHGNAWRYRDYVVASFNRDKPFDQFVIEQLAGDLLEPVDDVRLQHERLIATGFLSLGPKVLAEVDEAKMEMDIIDEQVDTVGRAFMALTLGCARCHNHKFDPIPTREYYALSGIFKSTRTMDSFTKMATWHENSLATEVERSAHAAHQEKIAALQDAIKAFVQQANRQLAKTSPGVALPKDPRGLYPDETRAELKRLQDDLARLQDSMPVLPSAMGVTDGAVTQLRVHVRGSHLTLGPVVPRGFPQALTAREDSTIPQDRSGRLRLAQWLTGSNHPLTSRVIVNRIWRWHFGQGLVPTPDNFGKLGEQPVNQPLLDWLASDFRKDGWSIKRLHRQIMLSATYRMSSESNAQAASLDPENRLQWRAGIRRLEAETIRDCLLAVSGTLDGSFGGSLLSTENRKHIFNHTSKDETNYESHVRSIYLPVVRNNLYDVFQLFDYSDASTVVGHRTTSTVAPQALFMLNSPLVGELADDLAESLPSSRQDDDRGRVQRLYLRALGRRATGAELRSAARFLSASVQFDSPNAAADQRRQQAWSSLCHAVLASNEFIYVR